MKPTEIRPRFKDSLASWDAGLFGKARSLGVFFFFFF